MIEANFYNKLVPF